MMCNHAATPICLSHILMYNWSTHPRTYTHTHTHTHRQRSGDRAADQQSPRPSCLMLLILLQLLLQRLPTLASKLQRHAPQRLMYSMSRKPPRILLVCSHICMLMISSSRGTFSRNYHTYHRDYREYYWCVDVVSVYVWNTSYIHTHASGIISVDMQIFLWRGVSLSMMCTVLSVSVPVMCTVLSVSTYNASVSAYNTCGYIYVDM